MTGTKKSAKTRVVVTTALWIVSLCAVAAAFALVLSSCAKKADKDAAASEPTKTVFAVETSAAVRGQIRDYITVSGDIVAASTVDAYPDVSGKVTRHLVSVGQRVAKDQPLIEVDPSRPGMSYRVSVVKSPIAGTVTTLPMEVGATIAPSVAVARIALTDTLELRTYVAERFVSKIRVGLSAEAALTAWPGETFKAVVREVSPVLDPVSRTLELRLGFRHPDSRLKAGMYATVKVITEDKESVVKIPSEAVVRRFGETYAFVVEKDPENPEASVARKRTITPGILIDDILEVRAGLSADDEVVVRGQTLLDEGSSIRVVSRREPVPASAE